MIAATRVVSLRMIIAQYVMLSSCHLRPRTLSIDNILTWGSELLLLLVWVRRH